MKHIFLITSLLFSVYLNGQTTRRIIDFNQNWKFKLNDTTVAGQNQKLDDSKRRTLNLPHDWSIESDFGKDFRATSGGGALPGGLGWYRKSFFADKSYQKRVVYIEFDGVYQNSEVWINGHYLGKRPNGYISFSYDITPYIKLNAQNLIAVKVDNTKQPNSRWYTGSGIYRDVRLVITNPVHIPQWGTYITTPKVNSEIAEIAIETNVRNNLQQQWAIKVEHLLYDANENLITKSDGHLLIGPKSERASLQKLTVENPVLWDIDNPVLYKIVSRVSVLGILKDEYVTYTGLRSFKFDAEKGFFLNGKHRKINGVCNHHDLGALGAAVNVRALERQLEILKAMGVNAIRTAHNPPAPALLDLCDRMGFLVMNEAFDIWRKPKSKYDYAMYFDKWYEKDLTDFIKRDRNHPSVIMWSIGNEVGEQWYDSKTDAFDLEKANVQLNIKKDINPDDYKEGRGGINALLTTTLVDIVKKTDPTRPVTAGCNETRDINPLFQSGSLDIIGFNYHEHEYATIPERFPRTPFIVTESVSSLDTRGYYVHPSDSVVICPDRWDVPYYNPTQKCSAYDNCRTPWGATHENNLRVVNKYPYVSGQFIWTGFDYLGEPTPYWWPSRSSYFGIVDMAGFSKDVYYLYQSVWTSKNVLHVSPHWNWNEGDTIDVWAYYNNADDVELLLNGQSLGKRAKAEDEFRVTWRVPYKPGNIKAISRKNGEVVLIREINTAGSPAKILLTADRREITADGKDLSFITVEVLDEDGNPCPLADQLVKFRIEGAGIIAGTDNGCQYDHNSLKKPERNLYFGKCLAIVQNNGKAGEIKLTAFIDGFESDFITINCK